jgi:hypothetical protein
MNTTDPSFCQCGHLEVSHSRNGGRQCCIDGCTCSLWRPVTLHERLSALEAKYEDMKHVYGQRLDTHSSALRKLKIEASVHDLNFVRAALSGCPSAPLLLAALDRLLSQS